jgi:hypothetical protein
LPEYGERLKWRNKTYGRVIRENGGNKIKEIKVWKNKGEDPVLT